MRQRSAGSWELRVFVGVDPETGRRRYRSMTVRGSRTDAEAELAAMVSSVRAVRSVGVRSSLSELLEAWFAIASTTWAPTTIRQTRSVLDRYLHPHLKYLTEADPALHTFVTLAAFTGGRRAQLLALRWRNVDLDAGRLSFTGGWVEGPDGPVLAATKTKRRHAVDLDPGSLDVLAAHTHRVCAAVGGLRREGFVFSDDPDGSAAWKPNRVTKAFLRARRRAGLREFRLRPPPLHGHRDAPCRRAAAARVPATRSPAGLYDAGLLRPRGPRR
jgi:integrase